MILQDTDQYFDVVSRLLASCRGKQRAMTIDQITQAAGIPDRRITEQLLESRLADFPFLLVASGRGYYIPASAEDINRYVHSLHSRHRKLQLRELTVRRKAVASGYPLENDHFTDPPGHQAELFAAAGLPTSPAGSCRRSTRYENPNGV